LWIVDLPSTPTVAKHLSSLALQFIDDLYKMFESDNDVSPYVGKQLSATLPYLQSGTGAPAENADGLIEKYYEVRIFYCDG
jgi:hypothetical protein